MTSGVSGLVTITVTGQFVDLSDRPANGHVILVPVNRVAGQGWIVVGTPVRVHIKAGVAAGKMITNQAALSGELYVRVTEKITGEQPQEPSYVVKPEGTTLNLTTAPRVFNPPPGQLFIPASALGQPEGVATLGPDGKLTVSQRPPGGGGGVTSHHDLEDLADGDDHPQYLNNARGDVRYAGKTDTETALAGKENAGAAAAAVATHVAQADPHTQYLNNARGDARYVRPAQLAPVATSGTYADLTGQVPPSALPALAVTDVFPVDSQAEMLALTAQRGDIAIRADITTAFILAADDPTVLASWKQLITPADAVLSVNGQIGIVVLTKADVGLDQVANLAPGDLPVSSATQSALDTLVNSINNRIPVTVIDAKGDLIVGAAADLVGALPVGTDGQALIADASALLGVRWGTVSGGGGALDPVAVRYGCKAISMDPHSISPYTPQFIEMETGRLYQYWVPLPQGELVTGVRMPVEFQGLAGGTVRFAVYQDDNSKLGETVDVGATLQAPAVAGTWVNIPLIAPAVSTGPGVWMTALATVADGPRMVFCNTSGAAGIPDWLLNPASHRTALRTEGLSDPPVTLAPNSGIPYIDFLIGIY